MPKVDELISDISNGTLKLPEFQRGYIWTPQQVRIYVQSLYRGHPTGHFLVWHTTAPVKTRGDNASHGGRPTTSLLLDGQQRLTSLFALIKGLPPPFYEGEKLFFNIYFNIATEEFSYYTKSIMDGNPVWFSVHDFLKKGMNTFLDQLPMLDPAQRELAQKGLAKLNNLDKIHSYTYQVDDLKDEKLVLADVVEIFNRVNHAGTPLSRADLAMAHICTAWPEARRQITAFATKMKGLGFAVEPDIFIRATSGAAGGSVNFDAAFYSLSSEDFQKAWPLIQKSFEYLVNVLRHDAFIESLEDITSTLALIPILVYLAKRDQQFASTEERNKFLRWMYLASIWGRYTGATDTRLKRDVTVLTDPDPTRRLVEAILEQRGRVQVDAKDMVGKGMTTGLYKFAYVLARARGARDWFTGLTLYSKAVGKSNGLESHHIFPKGVLRQIGITDRATVNEVANRAFLTQKANRKISMTQPAKYLGNVEQKFPGALRDQSVPTDEKLWEKDNFDRFLTHQRKSLAHAMNVFLDKLVAKAAPVEPGEDGISALITRDESHHLEFKSTLRWDLAHNRTNKDLEDVAVKAAVGFLNADGGTLVIGVGPDHSVIGLEHDYESSASIKDRDGFERHLNALLRKTVDAAVLSSFITMTFHAVDGDDLCQVSIEPCDHPIMIVREGHEVFLVRLGNATVPLEPKEMLAYVDKHWPGR